jgi:tetratricopeptide (TPR) repeat protein
MVQSEMMNIVHLNNYGASFLKSADYKNAVKTLARGLQASRRLLEKLIENQEDTTLSACGLDSMMNQPYHPQNSNESDCNADTYLYQLPIHVTEELRTTYSSYVMVSVSLIFNLALAHHLLALSGNHENPRALLRKAARFYEYGFDLQQGQGRAPSEIFCMASLNNLGQVYQALGEKESAKKCFQYLISTIMELARCQELDGSIYEVFHRNAFHMTFRGILTTAAAAAA